MTDPTTAYAESVVAGDIVAGKWVRLACERHLRDLEEGPKRGLRWDPDAAQHALDFFPTFLRHAEGQFDEQPFHLEPFQEFLTGSLFGWMGSQGFRRFRTAYIEQGKGQGKTCWAAGVALYGLVGDGEQGAEIYVAAVTREQANIAFRDAHRMAEASPDLRRFLDILAHNIANPKTGSFLRALSSEHRGLDGKRPHIAIIDEIHEHPTPLVVDKMRAGTKARRQPLLVEITNSGYDRNSVCWHHHEYSQKVLENVVENDTWFAYVCGLDEGDDWLTDESCWPKANPGLGTILPISYLRDQVREAQGMPSKQNIVARLNFCCWHEAAGGWLEMALWDACAAPVDADALRGRPCYGGLDLSSTKDVTAVCLWFPPTEDGEPVQVLFRFWVPEYTVGKRSREDGVPYDVWVREGFLETTPGNSIDTAFIRHELNELAEIYDLRELAYDRWGAQAIQTQLQEDGFTVVPFGQGFASMSPAIREVEQVILRAGLAHGGDPIMRWMVSNVAIKQDPAGNVKFDKDRAKDKIDGPVTMAMAGGRAAFHTSGEGDEIEPSAYYA